MDGRVNLRNMSEQDRYEYEKYLNETHRGVEANIDGIYEAITTGNLAAARGSSVRYGNNNIFSNETGGMSMDMNGIFAASAGILGDSGMNEAIRDAYPSNDPYTGFRQSPQNPYQERPRFQMSQNQANAIKKYGAIVEFLGSEKGEKIASKVLEEINSLIVEQIEKNSQEANEYARDCIASKKNFNQYFQGPGWVCKVAANGPFTGSEAIFYHRDSDRSFVLKRIATSEKISYRDISGSFNIVHDVEQADNVEGLEIAE